MIKLQIKADFKDIQARLERLSDDVQRRVVPAALNKVAAKAKSEMASQIAGEFNIKRSEVNSNLSINRAKRGFEYWEVTLSGNLRNRRGRGFNLIRFVEKKVTLSERGRRARSGRANQIGFQIRKTGGKKFITGAFIGNNGRTVFQRIGKERLPIKALTTIDVAQMFNTQRINKKVIDRISSELPIEFDRAINAVLRGYF